MPLTEWGTGCSVSKAVPVALPRTYSRERLSRAVRSNTSLLRGVVG
jgi:hypothetical protein